MRNQLELDAKSVTGSELHKLIKEACDEIGLPQGVVEVAPSGRNMGAIFVGEGPQAFVLKHYGARNLAGHSRFFRELSFLRWGSSVALGGIPDLLSFSRTNRWIALEKLAGQKPERVEDTHIVFAGEFVLRLVKSPLGFRQRLLPAQERLVSPGRLSTQLELKRRRLQLVLAKTNGAAHVLATLNNVIGEYSERDVRVDLIVLRRFLHRLAKQWKTTVVYSPSDFGFHNCLEDRSDGALSLSFFDFEYAGADHPLKLMLDFLLQPDYLLTERQQDIFLAELKGPFPLGLEDIPASVWRLFVAKWMLIVAKAEAKSLLSCRVSPGQSSGRLEEYSARFGGFFG